MNPKPFASLNHFTVPSATELLLTSVGREALPLPPLRGGPPGLYDRSSEPVAAEHENSRQLSLAACSDSRYHRQPKSLGISASRPRNARRFCRASHHETAGGRRS